MADPTCLLLAASIDLHPARAWKGVSFHEFETSEGARIGPHDLVYAVSGSANNPANGLAGVRGKPPPISTVRFTQGLAEGNIEGRIQTRPFAGGGKDPLPVVV